MGDLVRGPVRTDATLERVTAERDQLARLLLRVARAIAEEDMVELAAAFDESRAEAELIGRLQAEGLDG